MKNLDTSLPIHEHQQTILDTIAQNYVTLLTAETGAGKSTRVPLWLWQKGKKVHVTQPRRIAARSLSYYLAHITGKNLGQEIGYQTGFDSKMSKATRLLYVTDGVQMIREINGRRDYDILVLDEVHEWNLNQEVLVGLIKKNLDNGIYKAAKQRVVIMSATLQAEKLSAFFNKAPIISVSGRGFPVTMHHNNPHFLLPDTAQMVELERNVLVFQPGKQEIENFMEDLERMLKAEKLKAKILPLHAELSLREQEKVFDHYELPKVVVATDIAQTSLTIDDIDAVVDSGIKKEVRVVKGIEGLYPVDISHAECMQRAGRAGRVREGRYFLCAEMGIKDRPNFPEPEIQRLNLESVTLRLIKMGISPLDFPFFHSPAKALIFKAIKQLKLLGAISEEGVVTPDGDKMAEFPVSLRSARLLLEAQKANPRVLDWAIKCIAILETKGIVTKEAAAEKYLNSSFRSDLLNQLALWESYKRNRKSVNQKKFVLAKEIYRELNKRLAITMPVKPGLSSSEIPMLYRAILSSFADQVFTRGGEEYQRDDEIRQLNRDSILTDKKPDMLVGLPFDLIVTRDNANTGDKEEILFPLITFASELTLELLEQLKPFSFFKKEVPIITNAKISVFREFYFGGKAIRTFTSPPNWENDSERKQVIQEVLGWYEKNKQRFDIPLKMAKVNHDFEEIKKVVTSDLKSFDFYWRKFFFKEVDEHLRIDDLELFFKFNSGFSFINLARLLPAHIIEELKQAGWPQHIEVNGELLDILYIDGKPFVKCEYPFFEKVREDELILPTGERAGVILGDREFSSWTEATADFNRWKRLDVFEKKYKDWKKPGHMDDLIDIPFPQTLDGARGKENTPLEYYVVPVVEDGEVFLKHYLSEEEAQKYFDSFRPQWEEHIRSYKKSKLENIFKQKGWKIKS